MSNMNIRKKKIVNQAVVPNFINPYKPVYKDPNLLSTEIRIDNINLPVMRYILKKYKDGSYNLSTYQQNVPNGCFFLINVEKGNCAKTAPLRPEEMSAATLGQNNLSSAELKAGQLSPVMPKDIQ